MPLLRAAERRSKRSRRNRRPVRVSCGDSLASLKLRVFEALGVHPKNQRLYARGTLLEGEQRTLAQVRASLLAGQGRGAACAAAARLTGGPPN